MNNGASHCIKVSTEYAEQGKVHESLILLERAMLAAPDDVNIVLLYAEKAECVASTDDYDTQVERLEALETFVRSRVLHVGLDRVDDVLKRVDELRRRRESLELEGAAHQRDDEREAVDEILRMARSGNLADEPPAQDIASRLRLLERARDEAEITDPAQAGIATAVERAQAAHSFDVVGPEVSAAIERIAKWTDIGRAARALQHVDAAIGPLVAASEKLDAPRLKALDGLLSKLGDAAFDISTKATEADARERWLKFQKKHSGEYGEVLAWAASESPDPAVRALHDSKPKGVCQEKLARVRAVHDKVIDLLPSLRGSIALGPARELASKLAEAGAKTAQIQQQLYDEWAMRRIREGYEAGEKHIGIIDDEKQLGEVLVCNFGKIDTRFLSHEVQRCYTEVFDLLYARLDKPDGSKDFDSPGNKLYVLKRMLNSEKFTPNNF